MQRKIREYAHELSEKTIDTRLAKLHLENCYDVDHPLRESVEIALTEDVDDSAEVDKSGAKDKRSNLQIIRHRTRFCCQISDTLLKLQLNCGMYLTRLQRYPER